MKLKNVIGKKESGEQQACWGAKQTIASNPGSNKSMRRPADELVVMEH
jgi:hypothetical protein